MEQLLNTTEVAEILRVKASTIRKWVHLGFIPYVKLGRAVRFDRKDVEKWIRQRSHQGGGPQMLEIRWP